MAYKEVLFYSEIVLLTVLAKLKRRQHLRSVAYLGWGEGEHWAMAEKIKRRIL